MNTKTKTILLRFVRSTGALVIGALIAFLGGPDAASILTPTEAVALGTIVTPLLITLDKWLRYGQDPGEVDPATPDAKA